MPFIDNSDYRRDLLKIYQPLSELSLNSNLDFIRDQWRLFELSIIAQVTSEKKLSVRASIAVVLDRVFFRVYEISGELATFMMLNRDKIGGYMDDPLNDSSLQYLEALTRLLESTNTPCLRGGHLHWKQQLALNLSFVYYAAHDNTLASLVATTKFFLQSVDSELFNGLKRPIFPAVKLITRYCTSPCDIHGISLIPGDRVICLLTPDIPLCELELYDSGLTFGHGIHKCPGQSFVTINHEYLLEALGNLKSQVTICDELPLASPYFSGLHDIFLIRQ